LCFRVDGIKPDGDFSFKMLAEDVEAKPFVLSPGTLIEEPAVGRVRFAGLADISPAVHEKVHEVVRHELARHNCILHRVLLFDFFL
jgi:hypothetical protein